MDVDVLRAAAAVERPQRQREGLAAYVGPFLEGREEPWILQERAELEHMYFGLLHRMIRTSVDRGEHRDAIAVGLAGLRQDLAREPIHRLLMEAYELGGDRSAALRQYEVCAEAMRAQYGAAPGPDTRAVYDRIRAGRAVALTSE